jgi:ATP-binding cassette, subfamily C (CFTR/MRP), member 1
MYWIIGLFAINVLSSIIGNQYFHVVLNVGLRIRTGLTTMIYKKTLKLSNAARQRRTTGEISNHQTY